MLDLILALPSSFCPLVLAPSPGPLTEELSTRGIPYIVIPYREWLSASRSMTKVAYRTWRNLVAHQKVTRKLRTHPIELIYTNTLGSPIGGLLALSMNLPSIWHLREFVDISTGFSFDYGTKLSMALVRRASRLVIVNSLALKRQYMPHIPPSKIEVIYNGLLSTSERSQLFLPRQGLDPTKRIKLCMLGPKFSRNFLVGY